MLLMDFRFHRWQHSLAFEKGLNYHGNKANAEAVSIMLCTIHAQDLLGVIHRIFTVMKVKPEQLDRLIDRLLKNSCAKGLMTLKADEATVRKRIREIIAQNFHEEEIIEEEAKKMLQSLAGQTKSMDQHRMFLMIKQRLAEKKGFPL